MFPQLSELFPANTPAVITIYGNSKNKYGENEVVFIGECFCNIQTKTRHKVMMSGDKDTTYLSSTAYIFQDLGLKDDVISNGEMVINGHKYTIKYGCTQRDPFNNDYMFIKLELI